MKRWIWIVCAVIFWGVGLAQWRNLLPFDGQVFADFGEGAGVGARALAQLEEQERERGENKALPGLAAWSVEREVQVENTGLGRVCSADCMAVYGDRSAAVSRDLAHGSFGLRSDRDTCVISRGLADALFGSEDVVGKSVRCRGKAYTVRGVIRDEERMIVIPAGVEAEGGQEAQNGAGQDILRYLLLDFRSANREMTAGGEAARSFLARYNLGTPRYLVDGTVGPAAAGFFLLLPLAAVLGRWAWTAGKRTPGGLPITCLGAAAGLAGSVLLLGAAGTRFPEELLPTRWSDFDFWARRWREMVPALRFAGEPGQTRWILLLRGRCAAAASGFAGAGLALLMASAKRTPDCKRNVIDTPP